LARWLIYAALGMSLTGCGTLSGTLRVEAPPTAPPAVPVGSDVALDTAGAGWRLAADEAGQVPGANDAIVSAGGAAALAPVTSSEAGDNLVDLWMAQARDSEIGDEQYEQAEQYDPWEPFNERMLEVNRKLDRWVLKPVAQAYNFITPDELQIMISNGFDNISFPPRFVNSLLQGKFKGATREIGRFLINSTIGVGGLFDPAKDVFGLVKSREDFGQTLGFYGVGPGPFLIVPLMEPMTVRDGVGKFVDGAMDPLVYYLPFIWERLGMKIGDTINERSLNLDLFQGFEESVIDLYSAVRHGYLQRRQKMIRE
jgi:phospholipid-binding lipoprotein MlaA